MTVMSAHTCRIVYAVLIAIAAWIVTLQPAQAHFLLNINIRVVHVEHLKDGVRVFVRLPTPYVLAQRIGPRRADGTRDPAPYTRNVIEDGQLMHYVDLAAVREDPLGLGQLVAAGHRFVTSGAEVLPQVEAVRLHSGMSQPPFATLSEARQVFEVPVENIEREPLYVGDTVLDVALLYKTGGPIYRYALSSNLDPKLKGQEDTANLVIDHFPGGTRVFRATGLLQQPIVVSRSAISAAWTFIKEGVEHILKGFDHVLFVICLTLGATSIGSLLWRVTGFTVGHSITLTIGFLGYVPSGDWFIPAVEAGIALSIVYAAVIALQQKESGATFLITAVIGLLHGLGFSFVLSEILQVDSPNLWQSLLSFNVGVEFGQVALVIATWPLFRWTATRRPWLWPGLRTAVAIPSIAIAAIWLGQRLTMVVTAVPST